MQDDSRTSSALDLNTLGDRVLLAAIGICAATCVFLGLQFIDSGTAIGATIALLVITAVGYAMTRGTTCFWRRAVRRAPCRI